MCVFTDVLNYCIAVFYDSIVEQEKYKKMYGTRNQSTCILSCVSKHLALI